MKEKIVVGYIGCGRRGRGVLKNNLAKMQDVEIKYICDLSEKRMERATEHLLAGGAARPLFTKDYHDILNDRECANRKAYQEYRHHNEYHDSFKYSHGDTSDKSNILTIQAPIHQQRQG